ncbi:endonuclease Q family protein [Cohnella faecalis]|nr:endonuclease Q family protein [Cohnella faecalis]
MDKTNANDSLQPLFADLHVHIGRSGDGHPIKISGSRDLTFRSIAEEASDRKGISLIGIIDAHSPPVQEDILRCLDTGEMEEVAGGGIRYRDTVIVLGAEMEIREEGGGPFHLLGYLPNLAAMQEWTEWMRPRMKNVTLSSQRIRVTARELQEELLARGGLLVPAHVFTPHRGLLGCSADRLADRLDPEGIAAIELGLSSNTDMASRISETDRYPFLTNSDAHSTGMIGRECNEIAVAEPSFEELSRALRNEDGRRIVANYGLHPQLGKYHTNVADRIDRLADRGTAPESTARPLYREQVPLNFFPGIGPVLKEKLHDEVGTEMDILHRVPRHALEAAAGEKIAELIWRAREGKLAFIPGSGGKYGRLAQS